MIQLVGPGGAGKTTTGTAVAAQLRIRFVDLDVEFSTRHGDISAYIDEHGYDAYARQNVFLYSVLIDQLKQPDVLALSSGFMAYRDEVHSDYARWRQQVASSDSTFVLLPSIDVET